MNANHHLVDKIRATKGDGPCVSIYFKKPDRRLSQQVPSIELYRQLAYARRLLGNSLSRQAAADYVKPLWNLAKGELLNGAEGTIGLFRSGEVSSRVRLPAKIPTQTVVATDFHIKPLVMRDLSSEVNESWFKALNLCNRAMNEGRARYGLYPVAQVLRNGKARRLWVAADLTLWGILDRDRGTIVLHSEQMNDRDGDILDNLAEWAMDLDVEVHVLPKHQIPDQYAVIAEI